MDCIFAPYMLLAFIDDPLQTSFIYLLVAIVVVCLFFFVNGAVNVFVDSKSKLAIGDFFITCWAAVISIIYMLVVIIYMFTLGSFSNFQTLILPSLLGVLSLILLKLVKTAINPKKKTTWIPIKICQVNLDETVIDIEEDGMIIMKKQRTVITETKTFTTKTKQILCCLYIA